MAKKNTQAQKFRQPKIDHKRYRQIMNDMTVERMLTPGKTKVVKGKVSDSLPPEPQFCSQKCQIEWDDESHTTPLSAEWLQTLHDQKRCANCNGSLNGRT